MCYKLIAKLVGREFTDVDVIDIKPWIMHAEVAEKFTTSNNRIILAGDAAHRFPPAGGFGEYWFCLPILSFVAKIISAPISISRLHCNLHCKEISDFYPQDRSRS